jgi:hypothetical protein
VRVRESGEEKYFWTSAPSFTMQHHEGHASEDTVSGGDDNDHSSHSGSNDHDTAMSHSMSMSMVFNSSFGGFSLLFSFWKVNSLFSLLVSLCIIGLYAFM